MNGYERMLATLNKERVDYTPSAEIFFDETVIKAFTGTNNYHDLVELFDLDAVVANTPSKLYRKKAIDAGKGIFENEWGTVRQEGKETVSAVIDYPIKSVKDVYSYKAPDPLDEYRFRDLTKLLERFKNKRLVGIHVHDVFNYPWYLMGMDNLFLAMYEEPEAVHKLVDISVEHNMALARKGISLGADFVLIGDDYGGGNQSLFSPETFREFFLPGLKKLVGSFKEQGAYCFKHCCGNLYAILDDLVSTGIDVLHPLDPSAGMDIMQVKEDYPDLVVMGGINCFEPLCSYSLFDICEETRHMIETIGKNGRYIIASSNSIHSGVKPENYLAMNYIRKSIPVIYEGLEEL